MTNTQIDNYTGVSYAQNKQDVACLVVTNFKRRGYFVEFGACDGLLLSNTLLLEREYDWTGIVAEPNRAYNATLHTNRRCATDIRAVSSRSYESLIFRQTRTLEFSGLVDHFDNDEWSRSRLRGKDYAVTTISLQDLLIHHRAPSIIDYLSMDTEGSEYDILQAFDFSRYAFRFLTIEHNYVEPKRTRMQQLLARHGYYQILPSYSQWDDWFVHPDVL